MSTMNIKPHGDLKIKAFGTAVYCAIMNFFKSQIGVDYILL